MKKHLFLIKKAFCIIGFLVSLPGLSHTQTYTTLASGDWNDLTSVWSLDGISPCNCRPGQDIDAFVVMLKHDIQLTTYDVWVKNDGILDISINGSLVDPGIIYSLYIEYGAVTSFGVVDLKGTEVKPLGSFMMYGTTTFDDKFFLEGIAALNATLIVRNADIQIKPGGVMNFQGSPVVNMMNGDLINEGTVNYVDTCTILTVSNGNVNNVPTGIVNGNAAIRVLNGGITNTGSWSADMQWCAFGPGVGLPIPEDCGPTNCSSDPLPVELLSFGVTNTNNNEVNIEWVTASEINNSYFEIDRSTDVINWATIAVIHGAGTSNVLNNYECTDKLDLAGTYYYRLVQFDNDGNSEIFDIKAVTYGGVNPNLSIDIYPNPVSDVLVITVQGREEVLIEIVDFSGKIMYSQKLQVTGILEHRIALDSFDAGIYFIRATEGNTFKSSKFIINK